MLWEDYSGAVWRLYIHLSSWGRSSGSGIEEQVGLALDSALVLFEVGERTRVMRGAGECR